MRRQTLPVWLVSALAACANLPESRTAGTDELMDHVTRGEQLQAEGRISDASEEYGLGCRSSQGKMSDLEYAKLGYACERLRQALLGEKGVRAPPKKEEAAEAEDPWQRARRGRTEPE